MVASVDDPRRHAAELRRAFAAQLPGKIEAVEALWSRVQSQGWDAGTLQQMRQAVRALSAAAHGHGLETFAQKANELENFLEILLAKRRVATPHQRSQVNILLGALDRAAEDG